MAEPVSASLMAAGALGKGLEAANAPTSSSATAEATGSPVTVSGVSMANGFNLVGGGQRGGYSQVSPDGGATLWGGAGQRAATVAGGGFGGVAMETWFWIAGGGLALWAILRRKK